MIAPSEEYLALAATLLDELSDQQTSTETILLQLQALFGPMLTSALQLVDKREVVRVSLPSDRSVYQVSGSTGKPYTLHIDLPECTSATTMASASAQPNPTFPSSTIPSTDGTSDKAPESGDQLIAALQTGVTADRRHRPRTEAVAIAQLYCPCPGYAYNALAGDKNVLCKHLLAALIAAKTERAVKTEVSLAGVIDLLSLRSPPGVIVRQEET